MSYQIPHKITEVNEDMLVGLEGNFSEIQRFMTAALALIEDLEERVTVLEGP